MAPTMGDLVNLDRHRRFDPDHAWLTRQNLIQAREGLGLSHDEFGRLLESRLGCGRLFGRTVELWERGRAQIPDQVAAATRELASLPPGAGVTVSIRDEVDFGGAPDSDVKRRDFLIGMAAIPSVATIDIAAWERLVHAFLHPSRVDPEGVAQLEQTTIGLQALESELSPAVMLGPTCGHLANVKRILRMGSLRADVRRQLYSIAGETAGLAGWLMWELDDQPAATAYFRQGIDAAIEADDAAMGSYLVGCLACQPTYRERPDARLKQLDGQTFGFRRQDASPRVQGWLSAMEAEAHGLLGSGAECSRALDRAEAAMSRIGDRSGRDVPAMRSSMGGFFDHRYLAAEQGIARIKAGLVADGEAILTPLLMSIDPSRRKNWYWLYPLLAAAHIQLGDVEAASRLGLEALKGATSTQVTTTLPLVGRLHRQLEPWCDHPSVRDLTEQILDAVPSHPRLEESLRP